MNCSHFSSEVVSERRRKELAFPTGRVSLAVCVQCVVCDIDQFLDEALRSSLQRAVILACLCSVLPSQIQASLSAISLLPLP